MKYFRILVVFAAVISLGAGCTSIYEGDRKPSSAIPSGTTVVSRKDDGFYPLFLTVKMGTTVIFRNDGTTGLRVASDPPGKHDYYPTKGGCMGSTFDSCDTTIPPGGSWSFTFDYVGEWGYHNHLAKNETGTIEVVR